MNNLTKIMGAAALAAALATVPAMAQQQTTMQPFTPYNGNNAGSWSYTGNNGRATNAPAPVQLHGMSVYGGTNGRNTNYNPACDRNSRYYNPPTCR